MTGSIRRTAEFLFDTSRRARELREELKASATARVVLSDLAAHCTELLQELEIGLLTVEQLNRLKGGTDGE